MNSSRTNAGSESLRLIFRSGVQVVYPHTDWTSYQHTGGYVTVVPSEDVPNHFHKGVSDVLVRDIKQVGKRV